MPPKGRKKKQDQPANNATGNANQLEGVLDPQERDELLKVLEELNGNVSQVEIPEKLVVSEFDASVMISSIDVTDFKSYSGSQVIGRFHHALTGIIGPNGSGKSNVIDSLLFVFGFRSNKIRAAKLSSFIHKSSKKSPNSCIVTVNFIKFTKNPVTIIEKFSVSRTVDSNNKSKYLLNGRTVQFKEISKTLKDAGVDLDHNRFLILQGEVEQISLMKYKSEKQGEEGMLEYLDDIIGTSRFQRPLKLYALKLELVSDQRENQFNKVSMIEAEKLQMVGPVRELVDLLLLENKITFVKNKILSLKTLKYTDTLERLNPEKEEAKKAYEDKQKDLEELVQRIKEQKKTISKHQKEFDKQRSAVTALQGHLNTENLRLQQCDSNLKKMVTKKEDKEKELAKEEKKVAGLKDRPQKNSEEVEELQKQLDDVKIVIDEKTPELNELLAKCQRETGKLNEDRDKIGADLAVKKEDENAKDASLTLAQSKKVQMLDEVEKLESRLNTAKRNVDEKTDELESKENEKKAILSSMARTEGDLKESETCITALKAKYPVVSRKYEDLKQRYNSAVAEKNSAESNNQVLTMLMREKRTGNIPGIVGRLGNLGTVDKKHDIAISTNFGQLDMIVCDNQETVKKCLAFVYEKKLGRTQFVAMESLKKNGVHTKMGPIKTPQNLPRLFDLVTPVSEDAKIAFYNMLGDTLLAPDIKTAHSASKAFPGQRFNVVTADGEIVKTSGAMTGGGSVTKRGLIGTDANAMRNRQDAEELKPEMESARLEFEQLSAELQGAETRLKAANDRLQQSHANQKRVEQAIKLVKEQLQSAKNNVIQFEAQQETVKVDEEALNRLNDEIVKLEQVRDDARVIVTETQVEFDKLTKKIDGIYDSIAGKLQKEMDEHKEKKNKIEAEIKSLRTAASKAEVDLRKGIEKIANAKESIAEMEQKLVELEDERTKCEQDIADLRTSLEEKEQLVADTKAQLDSVQGEDNNGDEAEVNLKKEIVESKERFDEIRATISEYVKKKEDAGAKISKLKSYDIKDILADKTMKKTDKQKKKRVRPEVEDPESDISDTDSLTESEDEEVEAVQEPEEERLNDRNDPNCGVLPQYTGEEIRAFRQEELVTDLSNWEQERAVVQKTTMNLGIIDEYKKKLRQCREHIQKLDEITLERDNIRRGYFDLKKQQVEEFMQGFNDITLSLKEQYQKITLGGDADLELVDPLDPYAEGIRFRVRPRGKGWRPMHQTSGGEKTLSSLSLVFALHSFRPTPFYVMDEIDAALDARNVMLIAQFVKERAETAQFIIISLREQMFNLSDRLIGICKVQDCSKNIVIACREQVQKDVSQNENPAEQIMETEPEKENVFSVPTTSNLNRSKRSKQPGSVEVSPASRPTAKKKTRP